MTGGEYIEAPRRQGGAPTPLGDFRGGGTAERSSELSLGTRRVWREPPGTWDWERRRELDLKERTAPGFDWSQIMSKTLVMSWLVLVGILVSGFAWNQLQLNGLRQELVAVRLELAGKASTPPAVVPVAPEGAASLKPELLALRSEIAALSRRLDGATRDRTVNAGPAATPPAAEGSIRETPGRPGFVEWSRLPAAVTEALRQQLGDTPIEGARMKSAGDRAFFNVDTRLSDGRGIELVVDGQGQVLTRVLETPLEALSPRIQEQVAGEVGDVPVRRVAEVYEDGRTVYRVNAKGQEQAVQLTFSTDGDLLQAEVTRREAKP